MKKLIILIFLLIPFISFSQRSVPVTLITDTAITLNRPYPVNSLFLVTQANKLYVNPVSSSAGVPFYQIQKTALTSNSDYSDAGLLDSLSAKADTVDNATRTWVNSKSFLQSFTEADPVWNSEKSNYVTNSFLSSQNYLQSFTEADPVWNSEKSNYVTSSFLSSQNYLQSFTEADPVWNSEKSFYVTNSFLSSQNYLQSFTESDPVWNSEKSSYATIDFVAETIKSDTVIFRPDSINTIYTFSVPANDSLIFDSLEVNKAFVFNLATEASSSGTTELLSNFDYIFRNDNLLFPKSIFGSRHCDTDANVKTKVYNNKVYFIAYTDSNMLNFNVHLIKKLLL